MHTIYSDTQYTNESKHSEMGPVRQTGCRTTPHISTTHLQGVWEGIKKGRRTKRQDGTKHNKLLDGSSGKALSVKQCSTRCTGTVHTSTKARLISVAIQIRIRIWILDPDRHQNLDICSLAHCQPSLKISCKSVHKFLRKVANRQTDKRRRLHILLGGGNNCYYLS